MSQVQSKLVLSPSPTTAGTFERIEDKFFVPRSAETELYHWLHQTLRPSYPDPKTRFTAIQSLYLDTDDLEIFNSHFRALPSRFKLRTRRYAPDGVWPQTAESLLELKVKKEGVCRKTRFRLGRMDHCLLLEGHSITLTPGLRNLNQDLELPQLEKRLTRTNHLVSKLGLRPRCMVTYVRHAFEKDGLRVTVDRDLSYQILRPVRPEIAEASIEQPTFESARAMRRNFINGTPLVVEVKHDGTVPAWLRSLLAAIGAREVSFSKYCYSMTDHLTGHATGRLS